MADNQDKTTLVVDLDAKDALASAFKLKDVIKGVGSSDMGGLIEGLTKLSSYAGIAAAAYFTLKTVIEAAFEAENIRAVNAQFEILSKNAGVAGEELKSALSSAANGLIDDTELLKGANKALVEMGGNAAGVAKTLGLARQVTATFGGDLAGNWERINTAIASGQTRQLRSLGLMVDSDKAVKDYAKSLGVSEHALSQAGKQQAIMNALLETGEKRFKGVDANGRELHDTWKRAQVAMSETLEVLTLLLDKLFGQQVKDGVVMWAALAKNIKLNLQSAFGEARVSGEADLELLKIKVQSLGDAARAGKPMFGPGGSVMSAEKVKEEFDKAEALLNAYYAKQEAAEQRKSKGTAPEVAKQDDQVDQAAKLKDEQKFQADKLKLRQEAMQSQMAVATTEKEFDRLNLEEKAILNEQMRVREAEITLEYDGRDAERKVLIEQLHEQHHARLRAIENQTAKQRQEVLERGVTQSKTFWDGVGSASQLESRKAQAELKNFGKTGELVFKSFSNRAANAFVALGEGTQDAGEAMRGFMFGALADIAEGQGRLLLASVLVNPLNGIAGAGLLVLAGVLRGASKGSKGVAAGGGGGSEPSSGVGPGAGAADQVAAKEAPKKSVTIAVSGHYFETEQTKTRLVEMVRDASDATDFKFVQIGKS